MHCDVSSMYGFCIATFQSEISEERSKIMNFCKRSYQPILRFAYFKIILGHKSTRQAKANWLNDYLTPHFLSDTFTGNSAEIIQIT